jgi:NAD(P)-dependent dehydrogenase (short-subunit alcohol dehydrogenase family)
MNKDFFATEAGQKVIKTCNPMKRIGHKDEIRGAAILLASEASNFMTGSSVVIDGGQTCW